MTQEAGGLLFEGLTLAPLCHNHTSPPFPYTVCVRVCVHRGLLAQGLEEVLVGMAPGGKRRALVPPELGYVSGGASQPQPPTFATKRQLENHKAEPLLFEVQMLRINGKK